MGIWLTSSNTIERCASILSKSLYWLRALSWEWAWRCPLAHPSIQFYMKAIWSLGVSKWWSTLANNLSSMSKIQCSKVGTFPVWEFGGIGQSCHTAWSAWLQELLIFWEWLLNFWTQWSCWGLHLYSLIYPSFLEHLLQISVQLFKSVNMLFHLVSFEG